MLMIVPALVAACAGLSPAGSNTFVTLSIYLFLSLLRSVVALRVVAAVGTVRRRQPDQNRDNRTLNTRSERLRRRRRIRLKNGQLVMNGENLGLQGGTGPKTRELRS
jgi:hypothetical protein